MSALLLLASLCLGDLDHNGAVGASDWVRFKTLLGRCEPYIYLRSEAQTECIHQRYLWLSDALDAISRLDAAALTPAAVQRVIIDYAAREPQCEAGALVLDETAP